SRRPECIDRPRSPGGHRRIHRLRPPQRPRAAAKGPSPGRYCQNPATHVVPAGAISPWPFFLWRFGPPPVLGGALRLGDVCLVSPEENFLYGSRAARWAESRSIVRPSRQLRRHSVTDGARLRFRRLARITSALTSLCRCVRTCASLLVTSL